MAEPEASCVIFCRKVHPGTIPGRPRWSMKATLESPEPGKRSRPLSPPPVHCVSDKSAPGPAPIRKNTRLPLFLFYCQAMVYLCSYVSLHLELQFLFSFLPYNPSLACSPYQCMEGTRNIGPCSPLMAAVNNGLGRNKVEGKSICTASVVPRLLSVLSHCTLPLQDATVHSSTLISGQKPHRELQFSMCTVVHRSQRGFNPQLIGRLRGIFPCVLYAFSRAFPWFAHNHI